MQQERPFFEATGARANNLGNVRLLQPQASSIVQRRQSQAVPTEDILDQLAGMHSPTEASIPGESA